jgi:UDP-N-acetylmuramyl pentapeptide phosphotransferase/UDP-N-acetylglucosamine-1-phosphate transferase
MVIVPPDFLSSYKLKFVIGALSGETEVVSMFVSMLVVKIARELRFRRIHPGVPHFQLKKHPTVGGF